MEAEGVEFQCGVDAGLDISSRYLRKRFDGSAGHGSRAAA
jgi:NADPH-dependent glutamate synthase beta subunit-like oxidoreductase